MNVYLIILLFMVLCLGSLYEILTNKENKIAVFVSLCLFISIVAFRSIESPDTRNYIKAYDIVNLDNMHYGDFNIGFILLICVFKLFDIQVQYFFLFLALFNYIVVYIVCKSVFEEYRRTDVFGGMKSSQTFKPCVFSALFIPYFGLFYSGVALRAGIAMSFILASYMFLYRRKYLGYIALLIVAILFHSSAVLGLLLLLCNKVASDKQQIYLFLWIASILIWLSHISLIIVRFVPVIIHKLYELTNIVSFKSYELFYASSIRSDGFWGKKELFFLFCGLIFIVIEWDRKKVFHKVLLVFFFGILLAFSIEYITNSYRIIDFFLMFFIPCGCIYFMRRGKIDELVAKCCGLLITVVMQLIIAMNIIGYA